MSKGAQTLIGKATSLAQGLKRNIYRVKHQGIDEAYVARIENEMRTLQATDRAVEEAVAHLGELRARNNEAMRILYNDVLYAKKTIKGNYDKMDWHQFGIIDKQ